MEDKVAQILNGFVNLNDYEKTQFIRELNSYNQENMFSKGDVERRIKQRSSVGPKNSICNCCGR